MQVSTAGPRRRITHRLPGLIVANEPTAAPRKSPKKDSGPQIGGEEGAREKAQLRQELKALKAKEDVLRWVLLLWFTH